MIIRLKVFEQTLSIADTKSVPRKGSKDYLLLQFAFSSDWKDLNKVCYLQKGEVSQPIDVVDGLVEVPEWFTQQDSFDVTLFGKSGTQEVPTNVVSLRLEKSNTLWEQDAPEPQPPSGGTPYQQLVTDGNGKTKWEDRLAYETEPVLTEILPEQNFTGTDQILTGGSKLSIGQTYTVKFDNTEYECICVDLNGVPGIGNAAIVETGSDTGEPFLLGYRNEHLYIYVSDKTSTHTVSVSGSASTIKKIDEKFLSKGLIVNVVGRESNSGNTYLLFDKTDEEIYNAVNNGITVTLDLFGSNLQYIELPHKTFWGVVPYTVGSNGITKLTVSYVSRDGIGWSLKETYITASTASNS